MYQRNVVIIPATKPEQPGRYLGTPGKVHVVGYARVIKGTGAGVQIRKNIRRIILDYPEWELTFVKTDYRETESQDSTWHSYLSICQAIRYRYLDVLIIHPSGELEDALSSAKALHQYCMSSGVKVYVAHNGLLLSVPDFMI